MIPAQKSTKWSWVYMLYTAVIFVSLIITRIILGSEIFSSYVLSLLILSMVSACIPCIAGFFGKPTFFFIYTFSVIVGILYMFYVVLGNTAPGWGDLTSMVGYMFIVGIGIGLAIAVEVIIYFNKIRKN